MCALRKYDHISPTLAALGWSGVRELLVRSAQIAATGSGPVSNNGTAGPARPVPLLKSAPSVIVVKIFFSVVTHFFITDNVK